MDNSINCNNDILDVIVNKETIVRKRIVSFLERVFDYLGFDFRHDIFKSIVYCEAEYVTETEAKFKMAFDAFVFLLLNRKNQSRVCCPSCSIPRCLYAAEETHLPRGVLLKKPICIRYGSYTSSSVPASSEIAAARVSSPTGPPWNFSIIVRRMLLSI